MRCDSYILYVLHIMYMYILFSITEKKVINCSVSELGWHWSKLAKTEAQIVGCKIVEFMATR